METVLEECHDFITLRQRAHHQSLVAYYIKLRGKPGDEKVSWNDLATYYKFLSARAGASKRAGRDPKLKPDELLYAAVMEEADAHTRLLVKINEVHPCSTSGVPADSEESADSRADSGEKTSTEAEQHTREEIAISE
jgi:hypothetical protein